MALGLEPGRTVTLQTDRHSWGSQGDHPLPPLGHQGGWRGHQGAAWESCSLCFSTWGVVPASASLPAPARSREEHRGAVEKHAPPAAPPLHQGCTARLTWEGRQEGGAQTVLLFGRAGAAITLPSTSCAGEGHTPELPPAPVLSTCVCDGGHRETASPPPVPVVRTGCAGAPLQADSAGSAQSPAPAAWAESTGTGAEEQAAGSPASSRPQRGSQWGSDRGGQPGCTALGPAPVVLVPWQSWKAAVG